MSFWRTWSRGVDVSASTSSLERKFPPVFMKYFYYKPSDRTAVTKFNTSGFFCCTFRIIVKKMMYRHIKPIKTKKQPVVPVTPSNLFLVWEIVRDYRALFMLWLYAESRESTRIVWVARGKAGASVASRVLSQLANRIYISIDAQLGHSFSSFKTLPLFRSW